MRIISGIPPRTNMDRFYVEMSILTVEYIYNYNIGLFTYEYVKRMTPDLFDNFFRNISDTHQHNTKNATQKQFYITYLGTTKGQKTFSYCGPHIWNFIIKNINPNSAIGSFKNVSLVISCCHWWCYITLYIMLFFFLTRFFIAGCPGICYLTTSSEAGGGCFAGMMAFPFYLPFGVHVQYMERFYVCVYMKMISLHKVIYTKLFICYKAEVYNKEQNLHHCFVFVFS